jgi:hypothetical protein
MKETVIRFPHGKLKELRETLLCDTSREAFALLLARTEEINGHSISVVRGCRLPSEDDFVRRSSACVDVDRRFFHDAMIEAQRRPDVNTIIDVHTHPFTDEAWFSGQDDYDECNFSRYLTKNALDFKYGSVVFGRRETRARMIVPTLTGPKFKYARVKTQTATEAPPTKSPVALDGGRDGRLSRTVASLGVDTMRLVVNDQRIVLAGVGGVGSAMAENLVHMGFGHIVLIDHDVLEESNLNRFVGGTYEAAQKRRPKVDVVADHLRGINPSVMVEKLSADVDSPAAEEKMALSDFIMLSTDNATSRYHVQKISLKYGVPLISAGVNITVGKDDDGGHLLVDRSGEVITIRLGDGYCLNCLGRIRQADMAYESHPDPEVREKILARGYVSGALVREPAVKTLNSMVAAIAVESLVNQYDENMVHEPIVVVESHDGACMYPDKSTFAMLETGCASCL